MDEASVFQRIPESGGVRQQLYDAVLEARSRTAGSESTGSALTHAWVFSGPPGSGRTTSAGAFAAALLCTSPDRPGCGECEGCRTAMAGTHGDLKMAKTESKIFQVKDIREEFIPWAYRRPTTAPWRVLIVEDADRLNSPSANAMLKTVEEPPERTIILFCVPTVDAKDFSVTLRSRCRHVYIPTPEVEDVVKILRAEKPDLTEEQVRWAATVSNGHVGRARGFASSEVTRAWRNQALNLVESVFAPERAYLEARDLAVGAKDTAEAQLKPKDEAELAKLEESLGVGGRGKGVQAATRGASGQVKALEENQKRRRKRVAQDQLDLALTDMAGLYRDAMLASMGAEFAPIHPDRSRTATELARRVPAEQLLKCIDAVNEARSLLYGNAQPVAVVSGLVGSLQVACGVGAR